MRKLWFVLPLIILAILLFFKFSIQEIPNLVSSNSKISTQEIPYTVNDKTKLLSVVAEAKNALLQTPQDVRWLKVIGIGFHNLAKLKVSDASKNAVKYLEQAITADNDDVEILAYLGSAHAMLGRDSRFVVSKVRNVNKGLSYLDHAVKEEPNEVRFRLIRGSVAYDLPGMFGRRESAYEDYSFVAKTIESTGTFDKTLAAEIYSKLGALCIEKNEQDKANQYIAKAQQAAPDSPWATVAKKDRK